MVQTQCRQDCAGVAELRQAPCPRRGYPTRHSSTPSSAVTTSPTDPTGVRSRFSKCASVVRVAGGDAGQRPRVGLGAHHHHAVLDLAIAAIDHGKALDLALAADASVTKSGTLRRLRSASACTLVSCFRRLLRRLRVTAPARDAW